MRPDDPDGWDWNEPRPLPDPQPLPVVPEPSPFAPSLRTKLLVFLTCLLVFSGGLIYTLRYQLGLADGTYAFMQVQPGTQDVPVTYQACLPIKYVVNERGSIPDGQRLIDEAIGKVSAATGLRFVKLGATNLRPGRGQVPGGTVLIAWSDPEEVPRLGGEIVGVGGSNSFHFRDSNARYYFSGEVSLDAADLTRMLQREGMSSVRAVIMHELGHVVGLDHVNDGHELMNKHNLGKTDFGRGDLRGLARLGKGGCVSTF